VLRIGADIPRHHQPGRDADARLQRQARLHRERAHRLDHRAAGMNGALRVILVRHRIAEIGQQSVAQIIADHAAEPPHGRFAGLKKRIQNGAQILRIKPSGKTGRADQIAKHHGQLPAFRIPRYPFRLNPTFEPRHNLSARVRCKKASF
jgi:hypothetical protein